ncbi:MAG: tRNA (cytidine(34)-2'-O)-methyltransferase [Firmicutes bacterium ADurb.Bin146]|jgi:tRNA (cytidine/uridine-2'-O-)-methyltransferase|nr:MAG: tRNA (cytidine(34)-2'-O)-methyltransferase [Firmicutes bacterium ADurb.Bin146]
MINIVLVEPEIPQNTGNIARTCAATGCRLHLVKPFGFNITDTQLKRAGLDYWNDVDIYYYDSLSQFLNVHKDEVMFFSTTKASNIYTQVHYPNDCYILFGKETKGLDEDILRQNYEFTIRIPMNDNIRSLNLSNSVAIITYEILRQHGFSNMKLYGKL